MSALALILLLFAATAALKLLAEKSGVPLPSLLVLGGLAVAFIPGLPNLSLDPETIFLVFIPPLLYWTALNTSLRDLRLNFRSITLLAVWLVLITMTVVAVVLHALIPGLPWAVCFVLGAIVSPPDAVAVTASTRHLNLPRTALVILEGESLMNDATALVAYQIALAAAVTGTFSLPRAGADLLLTGAGGVAVGLTAGWVIGWLRVHMPRSSVVENTLSLLSPFIAYIPADKLHCSGVLAVVAAGLYLGRANPRIVNAQTRLQATSMWQMLSFLLEGLVFIFIGLQLPQVVRALEPAELTRLIWVSFAIAGAMTVTRIVWMFPGAYLPRWLQNKLGRPTPYPSWRNVLFLGWAGIRGGDSLVIALALPYVALHGAPLPGRNELIFITFVVILITLVLQGLTLAPVIRLLGVVGGNEEQLEEQLARTTSVEAGLTALGQQQSTGPDSAAAVAALRRAATYRRLLLTHPQETSKSYVRLRLAMLKAERESVVLLRDRNEISDAVMRRLQQEFDHEETLLHQRHPLSAAEELASD